MPSPRELTPKTVPVRAMRFAADLVAVDGAPAQQDGMTLYPFQMLARTTGVATHPWWGRCVHDFAGMKAPKSSITVDYCHCQDDVVGFANKIEVTTDGLRLAGALVSTAAGDRGEEVAKKRKAGVPYEASILQSSDGLVYEDVPAGVMTEVNGATIEGPVVVFRQWELWGVAVCPYGSDAGTDLALSFGAGKAGEVSVNCYQETNPMATDATTAPTNQPPVAPPIAKSGNDYMQAFGETKGALWFAQGKTWEEAKTQFDADMADEAKKKDDTISELKSQLADLQKKYDALMAENSNTKAECAAFQQKLRGEGSPVSSGNQPAAAAAQQFQGMSGALGRFAGSITINGKSAH